MSCNHIALTWLQGWRRGWHTFIRQCIAESIVERLRVVNQPLPLSPSCLAMAAQAPGGGNTPGQSLAVRSFRSPIIANADGKSGSLYAKARVTSECLGQVSLVLDRVLHERRVRRPHQPASTTPHARGSSQAGETPGDHRGCCEPPPACRPESATYSAPYSSSQAARS